MKKKKWILAPENPGAASLLARELHLGALASRVLAARGFAAPSDAQEFLDAGNGRLSDPFLLRDMDKAVRILKQAIADGVRIAVYGDYDVDGVTATCILIRYLRSKGVDCTYYIPDRINEGYGLNTAAIQSLYDEGYRLLITVDSGITADEEALYAQKIGLPVIITDHHECKDTYPCAEAVVNPRRPDSLGHFRELAGVGVAFKLICAMEAHRPAEDLLDEYADIVALGTIADVMPVLGENRTIVTKGLERIQNTRNAGLLALIQKLGLDQKPITANSVSFVLAPRINAAGRLGEASVAAQLFLTQDWEEACQLAEILCDQNRRRQEEENAIYQQITARLEQNPDIAHGKTLVIWGEDWHTGVIGIVASRLADRFGVPCILISLSGDSGKGSGRSIKGFNLYAALEQNAHLLERFGGHELAVGLTVDRSNLHALKEAMETYAIVHTGDEETVPCIAVDCTMEPRNISLHEVRGLNALEPFGMGNPQPNFLMENVRVEEITPISHDRHVKMLLEKDGRSFYGFAFGMGSRSCPFVRDDKVNLVFSAEMNYYRGRESLQLVVRDVQWAPEEEWADQRVLEHFSRFMAGEPITAEEAIALSPCKNDLVAVFRHVKANCEDGVLCASARTLYRKVRYETGSAINLGKLLICLEVFNEFKFFDTQRTEDDLIITDLNFRGKTDINGSVLLRRLLECTKA